MAGVSRIDAQQDSEDGDAPQTVAAPEVGLGVANENLKQRGSFDDHR